MYRNLHAVGVRVWSAARSRAGVYVLLVFSVAVLMPVTGTGSSVPAIAHAATSTPYFAQGVKPPPTVWGACPAINRAAAEHKLVRRFDRATGVTTAGVTMSAGASDFFCGNEFYGFYHIASAHHVEWTQKGVMSNENWRVVADYSIAEALRSPMLVTFRAERNTFCYSREVSLIDQVRGITVDVIHPNVIVRAQDGAVITAYPSKTPCRG